MAFQKSATVIMCHFVQKQTFGESFFCIKYAQKKFGKVEKFQVCVVVWYGKFLSSLSLSKGQKTVWGGFHPNTRSGVIAGILPEYCVLY